jgi:hypothetical protein
MLGLSLLAAAEPTTVALFPLENLGLADADAQDLMRRVTADLGARPGLSLPGGRDATLDIAAALGEQLGACRADAACLADVAGSTGVDHLVLVRVEVRGELWSVNAALHDAETGNATATFSRDLDVPLPERIDQTRLTIAALTSSFGPAGEGKLLINVEEGDVVLTIDGTPQPLHSGAPTTVSTGAHFITLSKEGFVPFVTALEVSSTGQIVLDATLKPTEAFVEDYTFWAWTMTSTAIALGAVGVLGVLIGAAVGGASVGLVLYTNEAIRQHNADPMRTQEQLDFLNQLPLIAYSGYGLAAVVGVLSLLPLVASPVVFLVADNPFRYSE